jgi:hypothetical protein
VRAAAEVVGSARVEELVAERGAADDLAALTESSSPASRSSGFG